MTSSPPPPLTSPASVAPARVGPGPAEQLGQLQPCAVDELPHPRRTDAVLGRDLGVGEPERVHHEHRPLAWVDLAESLEYLLEGNPVAGGVGLVRHLLPVHVLGAAA